MLTVTKQLRTETGHRLNDYDGRCSHLHGHSYLWEVSATAPGLSANGMILDFKDLKKAMNAVLDPLDHALVLSKDDPLLSTVANPAFGTPEDNLRRMLVATNGDRPRLFLWHENPTAESFAMWAMKEIQEYIDSQDTTTSGIKVTGVKVWETATSFAEVTA